MFNLLLRFAAALALLAAVAPASAIPFREAEVTRVHNQVLLIDPGAGRRPAIVGSSVTALVGLLTWYVLPLVVRRDGHTAADGHDRPGSVRGDNAMTMSATAADLLSRLQKRRARLGVVGLGYVGLPLAVEFARSGPAGRCCWCSCSTAFAVAGAHHSIDERPLKCSTRWAPAYARSISPVGTAKGALLRPS